MNMTALIIMAIALILIVIGVVRLFSGTSVDDAFGSNKAPPRPSEGKKNDIP